MILHSSLYFVHAWLCHPIRTWKKSNGSIGIRLDGPVENNLKHVHNAWSMVSMFKIDCSHYFLYSIAAQSARQHYIYQSKENKLTPFPVYNISND